MTHAAWLSNTVGEDGRLPGAAGDVGFTVDARRFNRRLLIILLAIEALLLVIDAVINYQGWIAVSDIRRMANIAREDGIGTWFMAVQTLLVGATLLLIYLAARAGEAPRRVRAAWLFLAGFFVFMALDDAAQVHERLGSAFDYYASSGGGLAGSLLAHFPSYAWQLFIMPLFAAAGIFMFVFLWLRLGDNRARAKLIIALDCFIGALLLDFIEGLSLDSSVNIYVKIIDNTPLGEDFVFHYAKVIEEFLEMLAITLLLSMFFVHLTRSVASMRFSFNPEGRREG